MLNKKYHPESQEIYQIIEPSTQLQMVSSSTRDHHVSTCNSSCPHEKKGKKHSKKREK